MIAVKSKQPREKVIAFGVQQGGKPMKTIGGRRESKPPPTLRMAETNRGRGAIRQGTTDHLYFEQGRSK